MLKRKANRDEEREENRWRSREKDAASAAGGGRAGAAQRRCLRHVSQDRFPLPQLFLSPGCSPAATPGSASPQALAELRWSPVRLGDSERRGAAFPCALAEELRHLREGSSLGEHRPRRAVGLTEGAHPGCGLCPRPPPCPAGVPWPPFQPSRVQGSCQAASASGMQLRAGKRGLTGSTSPTREEAAVRNHGVASLSATDLQEQTLFPGGGSCSTSSRHPAPRRDKHVRPMVPARSPLPAGRRPGSPTARPPPPPPLPAGSSLPPLTPVHGPALCKAGANGSQCSLAGQQPGRGQGSAEVS